MRFCSQARHSQPGPVGSFWVCKKKWPPISAALPLSDRMQNRWFPSPCLASLLVLFCFVLFIYLFFLPKPKAMMIFFLKALRKDPDRLPGGLTRFFRGSQPLVAAACSFYLCLRKKKKSANLSLPTSNGLMTHLSLEYVSCCDLVLIVSTLIINSWKLLIWGTDDDTF